MYKSTKTQYSKLLAINFKKSKPLLYALLSRMSSIVANYYQIMFIGEGKFTYENNINEHITCAHWSTTPRTLINFKFGILIAEMTGKDDPTISCSHLMQNKAF